MSSNSRSYLALPWSRLKPLSTATVADQGVDIFLPIDDDPALSTDSNGVLDAFGVAANPADVDIFLGAVDRRRADHDVVPESRESIPAEGQPEKQLGLFRRLLAPSKRSRKGSGRPFWRRWIYTIFFCVGMILIWAPVILFVTTAPPVYNSSWTIIIPGTQVGASVDLVNVGEAYTDVRTPYGGNSFSPGVNF